jgi:transposase
MGKITRRRHTRGFKTSIIRELESGKNLAQLSRENNIHPTMISRWRMEYRKNPESAFSGNGNTYKEAAKNQELERLVGKLYAENEFLKKALSILEKRIQEEKERSKVESSS